MSVDQSKSTDVGLRGAKGDPAIVSDRLDERGRDPIIVLGDEDSLSSQHGCHLVQGGTVELLGCAKAPPGGAGRGVGGIASVVVLARTGPDEGVAFVVLIVEQVRVDRRVEGGIVELEGEVV